MGKLKAYCTSKEFKKDITTLLVIVLVIGIAAAVYFSTALERDYLYELINGDTGDDGTAYVYKKGNTMYVTSHPSFLKQQISGSFPHEWEDSITRVVIVDEISPESMDNWFADMTKLKRIVGLDKLDVSSATSFRGTFRNCTALKDVSGIEYWDTSAATDMSDMFGGCHNLTTLNLGAWDVSNVEDMGGMFAASGLVQIHGLEDWNVESLRSVTNMFMDARKLGTIGNLNNWRLDESVRTYRAFEGCDSLRVSEPYWAD